MNTKALLAAPGLLVLVACATNPAEDPLQIRLNDFDTRLGRVERVVSNQSLVDMSRRLDALEAQLRELRGMSEVQVNGSEALRKQQRDLYADLDKRIAALEGGVQSAAGVNVGTAAAIAGAGATAPVDDQAVYARAFEQLKAGDYRAAIEQFQGLMKNYPQSQLLDNAQYWIGEAYYVTRDYDLAAKAFRAVGERWPASRKAPDALLKLGYTQYQQKHLHDARATLTDVTQRFPGTDAARLAAERLQKISAEWH
jgi:tol-pal system protein YbgF